MVLSLRRSRALLLAMWIVVVPVFAVADVDPDLDDGPEPPPLTAEQIRRIAIESGIPADSPALLRVVRTVLEKQQESNDSDKQANSMADTPDLRIVKHLRGREGELFPDSDELKRQVIKTFLPYSDEQIHSTVKKFIDTSIEAHKKLLELPAIPNCMGRHTVREPRKPEIKDQRNSIIWDVLFVAPGQVPSFASEVLGNQLSIRLYDPAHPNSGAYTAVATKVPCLPYRIRITGSNIFKHEGDDALLNYDKAPNGRGQDVLRGQGVKKPQPVKAGVKR